MTLMRRDAQVQLGDIYMSREEIYVPSLGFRLPVGRARPLVVLGNSTGSLRPDLPDVQIAPISIRVDMATDLDLVCGAEDGPLKTEFIVEVWNGRPMLVANLGERLGELSDRARSRLVDLHNAMHTGAAVPDEWRGPAVTDDDDPRLEFQRDELRAAAYLSEPVDDMLASIRDNPGEMHPLLWRLVSEREGSFTSPPIGASSQGVLDRFTTLHGAFCKALSIWRGGTPGGERRYVALNYDAASYVDEWKELLVLRTHGYHVNHRQSIYNGLMLSGWAHVEAARQPFAVTPRTWQISLSELPDRLSEEHDCAPL